MKKWQFLIKVVFVFGLAIFFFALKSPALADNNNSILVNEVFPNSTDRTKEFIELRNTTDSDISLIGYTIEDGTAKPQDLSGKIVPANCFLVLYGDKIDFSFELNKTGEKVILKNNGEITDEVDYGIFDGNNEPWPAPESGQSLTKYKINPSDPISTDFILALPSPGAEYYKPVYSSNVIINEILPEPADTSDNEFIELYNDSDTDIDLSDWQIDDGIGGSSPYEIPNGTIISTGQYLVFSKTTTRISLNDDGDSARLLDPNGDVKSMIKYDKAISGQSYSFVDNNWQWTTTPTPGNANILTVVYWYQ